MVKRLKISKNNGEDKLPRKSEASVCWWQLIICNFRFEINWTIVVFPHPVGPTNKTGSLNLSDLCSKMAIRRDLSPQTNRDNVSDWFDLQDADLMTPSDSNRSIENISWSSPNFRRNTVSITDFICADSTSDLHRAPRRKYPSKQII